MVETFGCWWGGEGGGVTIISRTEGYSINLRWDEISNAFALKTGEDSKDRMSSSLQRL